MIIEQRYFIEQVFVCLTIVFFDPTSQSTVLCLSNLFQKLDAELKKYNVVRGFHRCFKLKDC
jgi:hypothetical protein